MRGSNSPADLAGVVKEIVIALLGGDWIRYGDEAGTHHYYIIRESDYAVEVQQREAFRETFSLPGMTPDAFEEWYVRAALAEEPADRLKRVRARVIAAGGSAQHFDAAITAARAADSMEAFRAVLAEWAPRFAKPDRHEALFALLQALRIERVRLGEAFVPEADRPAIQRALEARFLSELAERFPKVVRRASGFDWLSASDPRLREACRCYLYGFFRAAILTAASALEVRMKEISGLPRTDSYNEVIRCVFGAAGVRGEDPARVKALSDLFALRHRVAHDGVEPAAELTRQALELVRDTFEQITEPSE